MDGRGKLPTVWGRPSANKIEPRFTPLRVNVGSVDHGLEFPGFQPSGIRFFSGTHGRRWASVGGDVALAAVRGIGAELERLISHGLLSSSFSASSLIFAIMEAVTGLGRTFPPRGCGTIGDGDLGRDRDDACEAADCGREISS